MGARLFTALVPPAALVEELDAFLGPRRPAEPRLRWTRPEGWHLTTAFMGDVPERAVDPLVEALAEAADRTPAFRLRLAGGGAFPWPLETMVLWLGLAEGASELTSLAERSRNAAVRAGVRVDGARFVPHLTLARANRAIDSTRLVRVLDTFDADGWTADEFVLIQSHLRDRGNRYEVLHRFALSTGSRD
ncbi:MAG: RNA 2',3'-cyclic phosphodiesterase [Propioniciclava sp.]|nr:RNA 2',3'-cyclic phosphodiesterase [Propioniciclava sp.]